MNMKTYFLAVLLLFWHSEGKMKPFQRTKMEGDLKNVCSV